MPRVRQQWAVIRSATGSDAQLIEETPSTTTTGVLAQWRTLLFFDGDKDPAESMAFALGRIRRKDSRGIVGFFPSLQQFADAAKFHTALAMAYELAADRQDHLIVVGTPARNPERFTLSRRQGNGAQRGGRAHRAVFVDRFGWHARAAIVDRPMTPSCWWNVSVTIGTVDAFRSAFLAVRPSLALMVDAIAAASECDEIEACRQARAQFPELSAPHAGGPQRCLMVPCVPGLADPTPVVRSSQPVRGRGLAGG